MKGIFNARPQIAKTNFTWDVNVLLSYLSRLSPPRALTTFMLACKLATLLMLLSGQRGQSIHLLKVKDIECTSDKLLLRFSSPLKQTRPGCHLEEIVLPAYPDSRLCIVAIYKEYAKRTKHLGPGTWRSSSLLL